VKKMLLVPPGIWAWLVSKLLGIKYALLSDLLEKRCSFHAFIFPFLVTAPVVPFIFLPHRPFRSTNCSL